MSVRLSDEQVVEIRARFAAGARQVDLAAEYGISQNTVSSLVTGRTRRKAGGPITRNRARKLDMVEVIDIRNELADGASQVEIAERYGVTQQMVSNIASGRAYVDIGGPRAGRRPTVADPLTVEQILEIRSRVRQGELRNDVAAAFGVSKWTVDSVMRSRVHRLETGDVRRFGRDDVRRMRTLYAAGTSQSEIARVFDTDQQSVSLIVRGEQYRSYGGPIAGRRRRKFTTDQVHRIRKAFEVGTPLGRLASQYDTTQAVIRHIVTGATYSAAPGPIFEIDRRGRIVRDLQAGAEAK